jgi:nitrite reductase/ring-hydroxylating ferredoxin subunit/DMSO/TMAO reductase YedYZ heme-binding membrane subunit
MVQWNAQKRWYDLIAAALVVLFIASFVLVGQALHTGDRAISDEILLLRALGVAGMVTLHIALCIGPLARLSDRVAPLLYNRRHLGVMTFLIGLAHAALATLYYGGFGEKNPLVAMLAHEGATATISGFPFEWLGFAALAILFVMAATSHDFWLATLTPRVWKRLHMLVYFAYAALVLHVALGAMQSEPSVVHPALLGASVAMVSGLHIAAGRREAARDRALCADRDEWIDAGPASDLPEKRGRVVCAPGGARIALFRHDGKVSAISNVCAHQGGPLGEGEVIDGCVTCPWHGYQYLPDSGTSPPPYTEMIPTYEVRIDAGRVLVNPAARPPGTRIEPARITEDLPDA